MFPTPIQQRHAQASSAIRCFYPLPYSMAAPIDRGDDLFHQTDGDFVKGNFWGLPFPLNFSTTMGACSLHPTCRNIC